MRISLKLLFITLVFSACVVLVEGTLHLLNERGWIEIGRPTYSLSNALTHYWADYHPAFGVWHVPNASARTVTRCFDITYGANSDGARDRERTRRSSDSRVVVLGDSFVEGWGVERNDRFTDLLERTTGIEHLNFGTSGSFGTTQYSLLYEHLASEFDHSAVLVAIFPFNDFDDDDITHGRRFRASRYRPYWVGRAPDYRLVYHDPEALGTRASTIEKFAREFTYSLHFKERLVSALHGDAWTPSGYHRYTDEQLARMRYSLQRIVAQAKDRPVSVITIPTLSEIETYDRTRESPLGDRMDELSQELGFGYHDLLPYMHRRSADWREYFLACDGHWGVYGHSVARDFVLATNTFYPRRALSHAPTPDHTPRPTW